MCKRRKDGTYRYCRSRQPGARSTGRHQQRAAVADQAQALAAHLPAPGSVRESVKAPRDVVEASRLWTLAMSKDTLDEVRNYTVGMDEEVNPYLRDHQGVVQPEAHTVMIEHDVFTADGERNWQHYQRSLADSIAHLDLALEMAPRRSADDPLVVYRGIYVDDEDADPHDWATSTFPVGANVVLPSYSSTSVDPTVAAGFTGGHGVVFETVTRQAAFLDEISAFGGSADDPDDLGEKEVLLRRNSRFKVVGVEHGTIPLAWDHDEGEDRFVIVRMVEVDDEVPQQQAA